MMRSVANEAENGFCIESLIDRLMELGDLKEQEVGDGDDSP
jgi:hypothetical protein